MTIMQVIESKSQSVFNEYLSLTAVNDKYALYLSLTTECDLDSVACIFVIDFS